MRSNGLHIANVTIKGHAQIPITRKQITCNDMTHPHQEVLDRFDAIFPSWPIEEPNGGSRDMEVERIKAEIISGKIVVPDFYKQK